jgi:enoyl-[acyl-carrier protein] reductase I
MLSIDLRGKRALVAGIADDKGFGFAIARALASAGASICAGTWPHALRLFRRLLETGRLDASLSLGDGQRLAFERIYALDAGFDTAGDIPAELRAARGLRELGDFSIGGVADRLRSELGEACLDIVVHAIANGPEVNRPLLETSRTGYLTAVGASTYSFASLVSRVGPLVRPGGAYLAISYLAAERVVPGYGGGMSSAKAALESDARVLAYEVGRKWGHRVNVISAGPWVSRAASAISNIAELIGHWRANSPLREAVTAREIGAAAAFLCSPLASGITGTTVYVDKGFHAMGVAAEQASVQLGDR